MITKIVIDLECWAEHYPTGCVIFNAKEYIDGEYCDNANEFITFLGKYADEIKKNRPEICIKLSMMDIDETSVLDCVREIKKYISDIMYN